MMRCFKKRKGWFGILRKRIKKDREKVILLYSEKINGEEYPIEMIRKKGEKSMIRKTTPYHVFGEDFKLLVQYIEVPVFIKERLDVISWRGKYMNMGVEYNDETGCTQIKLHIHLGFGSLICHFDDENCMQATLNGFNNKVIINNEELDSNDLMICIDGYYGTFVSEHLKLMKKYDGRLK